MSSIQRSKATTTSPNLVQKLGKSMILDHQEPLYMRHGNPIFGLLQTLLMAFFNVVTRIDSNLLVWSWFGRGSEKNPVSDLFVYSSGRHIHARMISGNSHRLVGNDFNSSSTTARFLYWPSYFQLQQHALLIENDVGSISRCSVWNFAFLWTIVGLRRWVAGKRGSFPSSSSLEWCC